MKQKPKTKTIRHTAYEANRDVLCLMIPLLLMSMYLYGPRPLVLVVLALITARICDWAAAKLRRQTFDKTEIGSLASVLVFTMLLPASVSYYVLIFGVAFLVLVAKHAFGGAESYPFNPAAVGYAAVAVSWPSEVFYYPVPFAKLPLFSQDGVSLVQAASHTLKLGGLPNIGTLDLLTGNYAGPMGATFCLVLAACFLFLLIRSRVSWQLPLVFLATCMLCVLLFPRTFAAGHLETLRYEILSGGLIYAAVFLITDPVTRPKNKISQIVYAVLLGVVSMLFRYYGGYELGVCFAIILVNSVSGYIDRMVHRITQKRVEVQLHG